MAAWDERHRAETPQGSGAEHGRTVGPNGGYRQRTMSAKRRSWVEVPGRCPPLTPGLPVRRQWKGWALPACSHTIEARGASQLTRLLVFVRLGRLRLNSKPSPTARPKQNTAGKQTYSSTIFSTEGGT